MEKRRIAPRETGGRFLCHMLDFDPKLNYNLVHIMG